MNLLPLLLPVAVDIIRGYIKSSSTKKDDKILEVVQEGARYLADCPNCSITDSQARFLATQTIEKDKK